MRSDVPSSADQLSSLRNDLALLLNKIVVMEAQLTLLLQRSEVYDNRLDNAEVKLKYGFSTRTLARYRSSGFLSYTKTGNRIYYLESDILRLRAKGSR
jgi:hypothetical protein